MSNGGLVTVKVSLPASTANKLLECMQLRLKYGMSQLTIDPVSVISEILILTNITDDPGEDGWDEQTLGNF